LRSWRPPAGANHTTSCVFLKKRLDTPLIACAISKTQIYEVPYMLKKTLLLIIAISFISNSSCSFLSCMYNCLEKSQMPESRYKVGETVLDPSGSLWEYQGNFPIILGQITSDLRLLTVFVLESETWVMDIHEEIIPHSSPGDIFKLIQPGDQLMAEILAKDYLSALTEGKIFNATIPAPPEKKAESTPGTSFCLVLLLNQ